MHMLIRTSEEQLTAEIWGLNDQIANIPDPESVAARRAVSFLKQVMKSKVDKRATLRFQRSSRSQAANS